MAVANIFYFSRALACLNAAYTRHLATSGITYLLSIYLQHITLAVAQCVFSLLVTLARYLRAYRAALV